MCITRYLKSRFFFLEYTLISHLLIEVQFPIMNDSYWYLSNEVYNSYSISLKDRRFSEDGGIVRTIYK